MKKLSTIFVATVAALSMSVAVDATITGVTVGGEIMAVTPAFVGDSNNEKDVQQGFDEKQNVLLFAPLAVDAGSIAAGTRVNSHMLFLNRIPGSGTVLVSDVMWTFDGEILGVMSDTPGNLENNSTPILGHGSTTYPMFPFANRGFEGNGDAYSFVAGGNVLTVSMHVAQPGDWIRVVTAVPEPSTYALLGMGLGLVAYKRRKVAEAL